MSVKVKVVNHTDWYAYVKTIDGHILYKIPVNEEVDVILFDRQFIIWTEELFDYRMYLPEGRHTLVLSGRHIYMY